MDIQSLYSIFLQHPFISTDTRKIIPGSIFFALKGEHFDGNAFALEALQQGAAYAVVSDATLSNPRTIRVDDTLKTLQLLAHHHRLQLHAPVLAITGSNGKTTTKELITSVLSRKYKIHATVGNLNNHIGVPLTLLGARSDVEIIVCEMGANHQGEIAFLCTMAEPTHGIITNIGKAHLEGFGSLDGVQKAKGELFDFLRIHNGIVFVNTDDARIQELSKGISQKITFGFDPSFHPDVQFIYMPNAEGSGFAIKDAASSFTIRSSMFGHYNASNLLAAFTVGQHFGVDIDEIKNSLSIFLPGANRSEVISFKGCTIVKDAYNANPSSMELAVLAFSAQFPNGWIVLGDMKELGPSSIESHQYILRLISSMSFERIFIIGEAFEEAYQLVKLTDPRIVRMKSVEQLRQEWKWEESKGKEILLKGSRSMHLEQLLESLA